MTNAVNIDRRGRDSLSCSSETPKRGRKVTRGQHRGNADTTEVNAATRDGGHLSRLESANPYGITEGTRAQGSVESVSVSTREHEDAGNPGEEDNNRGLSQPSADEMPNPRMAPPGRDPTRSRR